MWKPNSYDSLMSYKVIVFISYTKFTTHDDQRIFDAEVIRVKNI